MSEAGCEASSDETPRDRAKVLILKTLGAKRVAEWCGVSENAVHQGLSRATDDAPVPRTWVLKICAGARGAGFDAPIGVLWPAMADVTP